MTIEIRRLTAHDAEAFRALRLEGLRLHPEAFSASHDGEYSEPLEFFVDRIEHSNVFGGLHEDALAGVAGLYVRGEEKMRHIGVLWGMYVRASARGTGLGAALVEAVLAHAKTRVERVEVSVATTNTPARRLYERHGFRAYGIEPSALRIDGRYYDECHMQLQLDPV